MGAAAFSFALKLITTLPAATARALNVIAGMGATGRVAIWLNRSTTRRRWLRGTGRFSHSSGIEKTENAENTGIYGIKKGER
jgi:hypothetical protein